MHAKRCRQRTGGPHAIAAGANIDYNPNIGIRCYESIDYRALRTYVGVPVIIRYERSW